MRRFVRGALTLAALGATGCSLMPGYPFLNARSGMYAYEWSHYGATQLYRFPPPAIEAMAIEAMADLGFTAIRRAEGNGAVYFRARAIDGRHVSVRVRPRNASTELFAQVGVIGDESLESALFERVALRFGTAPPALVPLDPVVPAIPGAIPTVDAVSRAL